MDPTKMFAESPGKMSSVVPAWGRGTTNVYRKGAKLPHDSKKKPLMGEEGRRQALGPYYNPLQMENLSRKTFLPLRKEQEYHENTQDGPGTTPE